MRIAFITKTFPVISETFIVNQITYLMDKGYDVEIFASKKGSLNLMHKSVTDYSLQNKCIYKITPKKNFIKRIFQVIFFLIHSKYINWKILFKTLNLFKYGKKALNLTLFFESQWFIINRRFDIIHAHFAKNIIPISRIKKKGIIESALVVSFHGNDFVPNKFSFFDSIYKNPFEQVNLIIANTEYSKKELERFKFNAKIEILPVALDTKKFIRTNSKGNKEKFRILFCGRLINWKGPDLALKVLDFLKKQDKNHDIELAFIGEGPEKENLIKLSKTLNLIDDVIFYGKQSQEKIKLEMEKSDVLLMPGIYEKGSGRAETQGLVIQEAQSMELPVLVSDVGGMKYGVLDGKTGFVVNEKDIESFGEKIIQLIENPSLKDKMGKSGRQFVKENYDIRILGERLEMLYKSLV